MKNARKTKSRKFAPKLVERKRKDGKTYVSHDIYPDILSDKSSYGDIAKVIEKLKKTSKIVNNYPLKRDISLSQVAYLEHNILWALKGKKTKTKQEKIQMKFIIELIGFLRNSYFHTFGNVPYFFIHNQEELDSAIHKNDVRFRAIGTKYEK